MRIAILVVLAFSVVNAPIAAWATPADAFGIWLTSTGGQVEVAPCGQSACGTIVGGAGADARNPDRALRGRPRAGLRILDNFTRSTTGWVNGRLYDPNSGNTYRSELLPQADGTLRVRGCFGPICRTQIWRRAH